MTSWFQLCLNCSRYVISWVHILLVPHVIYVHKLMLDHRRGLQVEHSPVPVLMKEGPEPLISPSLLVEDVAGLVIDGDKVHWVLLRIVHHLLVGVSDRGLIFKHSSSSRESGVPP
jgi:hypothetical protein